MILAPMTEKSLYEQLGGEQGLRKLVERFYDRMDTLPEVRGIRDMHADLNEAADKLFEFLSGWTGGPPLFAQRRGPPMLRARHLPFKIDKSERDQWMICMVGAVEDCGIEDPLRSHFLEALLRLADHMRNQGDRAPGPR